jgi:hypothetical protein
MLKLIAVFLCVLHSQAETFEPEDIFDFQLCPESHPYASVNGQQCCTVLPDSNTTCEAEAADCPADKCEDLKSRCLTFLMSGSKTYQEIDEYLEGNRPIYKAGDDCVWWEKSDRRWWSGPCENVGTNSGFAYLAEDYRCPYEEPATWKRGGSDEAVNLYFYEYVFSAQTSAGPAHASPRTATAAINVIVRNGRYKQTCRFVYRNGIFKCENNSS